MSNTELPKDKKNDEAACVAEFEKWLDYKRISETKRTRNKDLQEIIVGAMVDGDLTINTEGAEESLFSLNYNLVFPVGEGPHALTSIEVKPRLTSKSRSGLKNIDPGDSDRRVCAVLGALTGKHMGSLLEADASTDMEVFTAIAMYFL